MLGTIVNAVTTSYGVVDTRALERRFVLSLGLDCY